MGRSDRPFFLCDAPTFLNMCLIGLWGIILT
jgi:hypothetical protein